MVGAWLVGWVGRCWVGFVVGGHWVDRLSADVRYDTEKLRELALGQIMTPAQGSDMFHKDF